MNGTLAAILQIGLVLLVLLAAYRPLGDYMARVYRSGSDLWIERLLYRAARVDPRGEQTWVGYALAVLAFSAVSVASVYLLARLQAVLPFSGGRAGVNPVTSFNTAVSFVTNTDWQSYSPELVMSNLTQMLGLAVQNFVSAAVGLGVAIALIRGLVNSRGNGQIGNFWVDLVRGTVRILLPLSMIVAIILLTQGAVQSWSSGFDFGTLDGGTAHSVLGPFTSQEAIKEIGTNGGGTLAANSAHPFSNPTPLSNIVEIIAMLLIPVCLTRTYGTMVGDRRQGITVIGVMAAIWGIMLVVATIFETRTNGSAAHLAGAMMEGKEQRFGVPASVLFAVSTTGTSTGAVNAAHDSFSAGGGGVLLWNMLLGEVAPGGVGGGLYGILVLAMITAFVGGLLVGRSPEFLGKKIGQPEITSAALSVLVMPALVLIGTGVSVILGATTAAQGNSGPPGSAQSVHGFGEVIYAFASAANNNGSAFGGLTVTNDWFQFALAITMLLGRFLPIVFVLALAGLLARQRGNRLLGDQSVPGESAGVGNYRADGTSSVARDDASGALAVATTLTAAGEPTAAADRAQLPTHGILFGSLLFGTVMLVAGLTFFPAMALGPIAEATL